MNILGKLIGKLRRKKGITFDGWQLPLGEWSGRRTNEVPIGTVYLGSFGIMYNGEITGKYFDVYIIENGTIKAVIPKDQEDRVMWKIEYRENVIGGDKDA